MSTRATRLPGLLTKGSGKTILALQALGLGTVAA